MLLQDLDLDQGVALAHRPDDTGLPLGLRGSSLEASSLQAWKRGAGGFLVWESWVLSRSENTVQFHGKLGGHFLGDVHSYNLGS